MKNQLAELEWLLEKVIHWLLIKKYVLDSDRMLCPMPGVIILDLSMLHKWAAYSQTYCTPKPPVIRKEKYFLFLKNPIFCAWIGINGVYVCL